MNNKINIEKLDSLKTNKNETQNTFNIIKEGWEKLSLEYDILVKNAKSFNDSLNEEHKNNFKPIIISLEKFKDDFKNVIFNISLSLGNISSNNSNKNNNEININLSVKNSYDNIYNEFLELESITKKMIYNQNKIQNNRSNHFQNLEKKLQGYLEEINEFDFKKINKNINKFYDENNFNQNNINEKINMFLQKNNTVEKYNPFEYNFNTNESENDKNEEEGDIVEDYENENDNIIQKVDIVNRKNKNKNNKENSGNMLLSTEEKDIKILNEIINMEGLNQDEAVKYIKLLINNEKNIKNSN